MGKRCYNGGDKHKYTPRYTTSPIDNAAEAINNICKYNASIGVTTLTHQLVDSTQHRLYLGDICVWCGDRIMIGEGNDDQ